MIALLGLVPWRVWLYAGLVAAALGVVVYYHHTWYNQGYDAEKQQITDANKKAQDNADQAQKKVDDCYDLDGSWDRTVGVCIHSAH